MISVRKSGVDLVDLIRHSPVADTPGAMETMQECMKRSVEVRYGLIDGEVACVWGLIPPTILSDTAYLWLLTTDVVARKKFLFIRYSQIYVEHALRSFPIIVGDCMANNASAIRWLRWLGAEFHNPVGLKIPFTIRAKNG